MDRMFRSNVLSVAWDRAEVKVVEYASRSNILLNSVLLGQPTHIFP